MSMSPVHVFGPDEECPAALPGTTLLSMKSVQNERYQADPAVQGVCLTGKGGEIWLI